jgi:hypothetical protein
MDDINHSLRLAYRVFRDAGLAHDDIYLLHPNPGFDADEDGTPDVDALSTLAAIEDAITTWAVAWVGSDTPFYLYLVDHGGWDRFHADVGVELLSADLNDWLDTLERDAGADRINVIIEACHSGSFIGYPGSLSKDGRVIITSTSDKCRAFVDGSGGGAAFSNVFLSQMGASVNLKEAFEAGEEAVKALKDIQCGGYQEPWMDDNADRQYDDHDGAKARLRVLGSASLGGAIEIDAVGRTPVVDGGATITATVYGEGLDWVWAQIIPPSAATDEDDTLVPIEGTKVILEDPDGDHVYSTYYGGFTEVGVYQVVIYARDKDEYQAVPRHLELSTGQRIYLPVVLRGN